VTPRAASAVLKGLRIGVTRPADRSGTLAERFGDLGADVVVVPLREIRPLSGSALEDLANAFETIDDVGWVAVTSMGAVPGLIEAIGDPIRLGGLRIAAVGPTTAQALEDHGVSVSLVGDAGAGGANLAMKMGTPEPSRSRVIFASTRGARRELPETLADSGWIVDERLAYESIPAPFSPEDAEALRSCDLVLVTSPSAVDAAMVDAQPPLISETTTVVAIGSTTATRAAERGLTQLIVASEPTDEGLFEATVAWARKDRGGA